MVDAAVQSIFKKGSKTYFYSTLFFPREIKEDVSILYGFVRKADDFVDSVPQRANEFMEFKAGYARAVEGCPTDDLVTDLFADLAHRKGFRSQWVDAFLGSMESDLSVSSYDTFEQLDRYLYGSAEVVGLMMARIMDLPNESYAAARHLGKAMQYINFIRDIEEDLALGRSYFPGDEMERFGLESLAHDLTSQHPDRFRAFIRDQIRRYRSWLRIAAEGFAYIPRKYLIPIKTASDMYSWTADQIAANPFIVYTRKVKPSILRIVSRATLNAATISDINLDSNTGVDSLFSVSEQAA